jgi:hypothetical protein
MVAVRHEKSKQLSADTGGYCGWVTCHGARLNSKSMSRNTVGDNSLRIRKPEAPCSPGHQHRVALGVAHSDSSIVTAKLAPHRTPGKIAGDISNHLPRRSKSRLEFKTNPILPQLPLPVVVRPQICILNICGFPRRCFYGVPRDMPQKRGVFACGPYVGPFSKCQGFGQVQIVHTGY